LQEAYKELAPVDDPYCVTKGMLLEHGIPVSELTIEDMRVDDRAIVHILINVALQAYAKMGGVPYVLRADPDDKLELILGVGRADVGPSRFGKKRVVGFATVFKNNGDYLVGAVRPFKSADDYADEFGEVIVEGLREAIQREGAPLGAPVRLIFHIYKQAGKGKEVAGVESALNKFSDHPTEFALVHVSDSHPWIAADEDDMNGIAPRGQIVELGARARLINLIGPREYLKKGTPAPLKVSVDRRSTYSDVDRIAQQVYDFANVSWRGFNIARKPVTIHYAQLAAGLAGKLEQTPYWNPTMLETFLRDKRWFL
jgi:argonaute-like protein implicated in RNA metabolism and viral defense